MVSPLLKQIWAVSAVLSNMVGQGMLLGYTTSLLPALMDPESPIKTDLKTASWLASTVGLAGVPGFLIASFLMDILGRKKTHILMLFPGMLGWIMIYFSNDIPLIMTGRTLGGITAGATVSLGAVVIGEYSSPVYRGTFLNLKTAAVCFGGMSIHILAHFFPWRTLALLALIPYFLALSINLTWPESPAWLASRQDFEGSEKSFYWLRGKDESSWRELEDLIKSQIDRPQATDPNCMNKVTGLFKKFTRKDFIKPMTIILVASFLLEMSGRHIFPAYALQIIGEITGETSQSFYYTLGIDVIITGSAIFSSILVKVMKRRTLLFTTGLSAFIVLMTVCMYLFLVSRELISNDRQWIPLSLFVLYFILSNLGCTPIPLALLGELYPLAHRGIGSAISGVIMSLCLMVGLQFTPYLLASIKVYGTFTVYGLVVGLALFILYFMLPETKDRTLQEIEDYFNHGKYKDEEVNKEEVEKMLPK